MTIIYIINTIILIIPLLISDNIIFPFALQTTVFAYLSIIFVILFVVAFATGPGSIPWFFVYELFNQSARPMAASLAVVTNWTANFLVAQCFEPMRVCKLLLYNDYSSKLPPKIMIKYKNV